MSVEKYDRCDQWSTIALTLTRRAGLTEMQ
jgi:hypothetical protein